jgi:hypothetical protein
MKTKREEEGFFVFPSEFGDAEVSDTGVRDSFISAFDDRSESDTTDAAVADFAFLDGLFLDGGPLLWPTQSAVPELAGAERVIARVLELHDEWTSGLSTFSNGLLLS